MKKLILCLTVFVVSCVSAAKLQPAADVGPETNKVHAADIIARAVEKKDPAAMFELGFMRWREARAKGMSVEQFIDTSVFAMVKVSAQRGYGPSCAMVGDMLLDCSATNEVWRKDALYWLARAAKRHNVFSMVRLGKFHCYGGYGESRPERGVAYLRQAASMDSPEAYLLLGECHERGIGVSTNAVEAFNCYTKAAGLGDSFALYKIGCCHEFGIGTERDVAAAFRAYEQCAQAGEPVGLYEQGVALAWGSGCNQDLGRAAQCFKEAAEMHYALGAYALGVCYEWGRGVEKDPDRAMELYATAVETGDERIVQKLKSSRLWLERKEK